MSRQLDVVDVTPHMAKDLLGGNSHNRSLRPRVVSAYAADMSAGKWQQGVSTILVAKDGRIIDGQHRLHAVVESDTTQQFIVVTGLDMEVQDSVDTQARRTFADVLRLRGEAFYTPLASVTRRVAMWERGEVRSFGGGSIQLTNSQLLATLAEHPELRDIAPVAERVGRAVPMAQSVVGLAMFILTQVDAEDAEFFFGRLKDGAGLCVDDPIYVLRRALEEQNNGKRRLPDKSALAYTIKAWNAYREGRRISLLKYRAGGAKPEPFPEPV